MEILFIEAGQHYDYAPSACALGYFDGIHRGHQQLIEETIRLAKDHDLKSAVLTFDPDPWKVLRPGSDLSHLTDLDDKASILASMGVDLFYVVRFTKEFAALDIEAFHAFLASLNIQEIVCGYDYTYASRGKGNTETLREAPQFQTFVIEQISDHEEKISSSRIERLIHEGEIRQANELLGYPYSIKGHIEAGYQRGRQLGFPTANLEFSNEEVCPAAGVYAGYVHIDGRLFPAMINIGTNPTFNNTERTIEAHIFDFQGNLYGKRARFLFIERLRGEIRFSSIEDLKDQLHADEKRSRRLLENDSFLQSGCTIRPIWAINTADRSEEASDAAHEGIEPR